MQTTKVACPQCRGVFKVAHVSPLGRNLRCPRCSAPFTIGAADIRSTSSAAPVGSETMNGEGQSGDSLWWVDNPGHVTARPTAPVAAPAAVAKPAVPVAAPAVAVRPIAAPVANHQRSDPARVPASPLAPNKGKLVAVCTVVAGLTLLIGVGAALAVVNLANKADQNKALQSPAVVVEAEHYEPSDPIPARKEPLPNRNPNLDIGQPPKKRAQPDFDNGPAEPAKQEAPKAAKEVEAKKDDPPPQPVFTDRHGVSAQQQKQINEAIDRGVKFIRDEQLKDGSWSLFDAHNDKTKIYPLGPTALAGLTLIECGVPRKDPSIAKVANVVRKMWENNLHTYELSLALLFLDRLGEKKDKIIIQAIALRLLKGQSSSGLHPNGGWGYNCKMLDSNEATMMMKALHDYRKYLQTMVEKANKKNIPTPIEKTDKNGPQPPPVDKGGKDLPPTPVEKGDKKPGGLPGTGPGVLPPGDSKSKGFSRLNDLTSPSFARGDFGFMNGASAMDDDNLLVAWQPPKGKQPPKDAKGKMNFDKNETDNSNTQFALLALWAARRHDVPIENAMGLAEKRFRDSQFAGGGWSYRPENAERDVKPSMTCVGLLGLALGKGTTAELSIRGKPGDAKTMKPVVLDDQIRKGLKSLRLEKHTIDSEDFRRSGGLYFVWSVERIGVLYDLTTIGDTLWYQWGANMLLPNQRANGSWQTNSYFGSNALHDTCFALLFLKRANLVQDFTDLNLFLPIEDPTKGASKSP